MKRSTLFGSTAFVGAMILSSPAYAQASETAGGGDGVELEEIIVTARKREERLIDVPISVANVSGEKLEAARVTDLRSIQSVSPNLIVTSTTDRSSTAIFMRGAGTAIQDRGYEQSVAVYIDGIYRGRPGSAMVDLMDIERVEVLRGPQSTLFGRNAALGAISVVTRRPSYTSEGYVEAVAGNYDTFEVRGSVTGPIVADKIAGRLSVQHASRSGFISNPRPDQPDADGYSNWSARGQLLFDIGEDTSLRLIADYSKLTDNCCSALLYFLSDAAHSPTGPYRGLTLPPGGVRGVAFPNKTPGTYFNPFDRITYANGGQREEIKDWGASAELNHSIGWAQLTALVSYREFKQTQSIDIDWTDAPNRSVIFQMPRQYFPEFSGEVRIANTEPGAFEWTLGAYYFQQHLYERAYIAAAGKGYVSVQDTKSSALFGQGTYHINDMISITGGLRYLQERKKEKVTALVPTDVSTPPGGLRNDDNALMGAVSIAYKPSEDANFYLRYSRGYKAGGIAYQLSPAVLKSPTTQPEKVDSYELGGKVRLLNNTLGINAAIYQQNVAGLQVQSRVPGELIYIFLNAGDIKSRGAEVEIDYRPTSRLSLSTGIAYTHARYGSFRVAPVPIGFLKDSQDLSGRQPLRSPTWTIVGDATYKWPLSDGMDLSARVGWRYATSYYTDLVATPDFKNGDTFFLDPSLTLKSDQGWSVQAWVKNLTNQEYIRVGTSLGSGASSALIYPGDPRTYGVTMRHAF